jgi:hypothetical protein
MTIENCVGEKIIFQSVEPTNDGDKVLVEAFCNDAAYLMTRYGSEYDIPEIPKLVKKTIIPFTYFIGRLLGKYKHFKDAPTPLQ